MNMKCVEIGVAILLGLYFLSFVTLLLLSDDTTTNVVKSYGHALAAAGGDASIIPPWLQLVHKKGGTISAGVVPKKNNQSGKKRELSALKATSPYAYSFILGGVDPDFPNYRDYLYGIFVNAYLLRKFGSTADMYLFLEMHHKSPHATLPEKELQVFRYLNVTLVPIPSMKSPSFYELQLHKFRILGLTQYRRVLHLDSDVMPLASLDYIFEYSDETSDVWKEKFQKPPLQENFVIVGPNDIANGGSFMLAPHPGFLKQIQGIIQAKERRLHSGVPWDEKMGWGHEIKVWKGAVQNGTGWTFCAASGDQGLLYYWVKHVKRKVSVLEALGVLQNWGPGKEEGEAEMMEEVAWPIPIMTTVKCWRKVRCKSGARGDFSHFMGVAKPWLKKMENDVSEETKEKNPHYYWHFHLRELNDMLGVGIDMTALGAEKPVIPHNFKQTQDNTTMTDLFAY